MQIWFWMNTLPLFRQGLLLAFSTYFFFSCRVISSLPTLEPDSYRVIRGEQLITTAQRIYVKDLGDSLQVIDPITDSRQFVERNVYKSWTFQRTEIDIDVFTLPFKIRPARGSLPSQLNSNFNAALYVGRRIDLYNFQWKSITPTLDVRQLRSRGFGYGAFIGIGSAVVNDFVVRNPIGIEYEGVVLDAGIATLYDARIFNIGLAIGIDYLTDSHRQNWIYQQRPWFGVLFGLNLN